jgi:uncharacterized coiled-coil DUF342 family protein
MKVTFDVPDKYFEIAKGILIGAAVSEAMSSYVNEAMAKISEIREKGEPFHIRLERMTDDADQRTSYSQIMTAIAVMGIAEFKEDEHPDANSLEARLEALQRQADELQRKIREGKS